MRVEIREAAVFTGDDGQEVVVWDRDLVDRIRSIGSAAVKPAESKQLSEPKCGRHGHKPSPASQISVGPRKVTAPAKPNNYGTRECDFCHETFVPRSGRAKVCDACRKAGVLRKKQAEGKGKPSPVMGEVRKAAAEAGISVGGGR